MPLLNSLATPYAEALLQVTEARGESETVADQCKQLLAIWMVHFGMEFFLRNIKTSVFQQVPLRLTLPTVTAPGSAILFI